MGNTPTFTYEQINYNESVLSPSSVKCSNTALVKYFERYLVQKVMSVFDWSIPENWDKDYFLYTLYCEGFIAILNTDEFGVIPQNCRPGGLNLFYRPKFVLVANPLLPSFTGQQLNIDEDVALIKMQPDYRGIMDIVSLYADMLALCCEAYGVNIVNSKLSYVFSASNKQSAESYKKLYDKVAKGEPAVVVDSKLFKSDGTPAWETFQQNLSQNYIAGDLISDMNKIKAMFNTAIGIPSANTDKKERLITDEVNANNVDTESLCRLWLERMQEGVEKANKMFGLTLSVKLKYPQEVPQIKSTEVIEDDRV